MQLSSELKWYLSSTAFFLVPGGIQAVLFPWLIAIYLMETPARVGLAQMAGPLPAIALILFGGWLGDRVELRRLTTVLFTCLSVPPLVLACLFYLDLVTYEILIAWVILSGIFGAFTTPARDAMLNRVAGENVQQVVTLVIGVQFGIQILGFGIGSSADSIGPISVLICMSAFMMMAAVTTTRLPLMPIHQVEGVPAGPESPIANIVAGLKVAWNSDTIRPAVLMIFGVGLFFASAYMVILPLMVRDIYHSGAGGIALAYAANMLGTCTVIFLLMRFGGIERTGRALILCGVASCCVLSLLYFEMPQWLFYLVIYLWGMCGGISMTLSRAIVQEASPPTHRARLMSVYTLGMMTGMPIGSVFLGFCVGLIGERNAALIPGAGMLMMLLYIYLTTNLYEVRRMKTHVLIDQD